MKKFLAVFAAAAVSSGAYAQDIGWSEVSDLTWGTINYYNEATGLTVQAMEGSFGTPAIDGLKTSALSYDGTSGSISGGYDFTFKLSSFDTSDTQSALFISIFNPTSSVFVDPSKCFVFEINLDSDGMGHEYYSPRWGFGNTTDHPDTNPVLEGSEWQWGADQEIVLSYRIENSTELTVQVTYLDATTGEYETYTSQTYTLDAPLTDLTQLIGFTGVDADPYSSVASMNVTNFTAVPEPAELAAALGALAIALAVWRRRK